MTEKLKTFLNNKVDEYNQPFFIASDPIAIPHMFSKKQDIEISALFASIFAWGNRLTIINKARELMERMDMNPFHFIRSASDQDLKKLFGFRHRTFNETDLFYFVEFLRHHYSSNKTLETAFTRHGENVYDMLSGFHHYFFSLPDVPARTRKHISTPERGSTCKRLNMFLRWMVRTDDKVDFGIWKNISPSQLIIPIDIHVARVARKMKLLQRKQTDWLAAEELTETLRQLDPSDPVRYDFALFGLGVLEKVG